MQILGCTGHARKHYIAPCPWPARTCPSCTHTRCHGISRGVSTEIAQSTARLRLTAVKRPGARTPCRQTALPTKQNDQPHSPHMQTVPDPNELASVAFRTNGLALAYRDLTILAFYTGVHPSIRSQFARIAFLTHGLSLHRSELTRIAFLTRGLSLHRSKLTKLAFSYTGGQSIFCSELARVTLRTDRNIPFLSVKALGAVLTPMVGGIALQDNTLFALVPVPVCRTQY